MLQDSGTDAVFQIGDTSFPVSCPTIWTKSDITAWTGRFMNQPWPAATDPDHDKMCCLFYTSGSTGKPKGIQITQGNIESFILWYGSVVSEHIPAKGGRALNFFS